MPSTSRKRLNLSYEDIAQPLKSNNALKLYLQDLTDYEQAEIQQYSRVYYLGLGALKNKATSSATNNYGFDDERGDYYLVHHDHIAFRYEILDLLGKGSFSIVTKAYDHKTKRIVALKIMRNGKQFHQAATIEAKVLQYLNQKDTDESYNIITLHEVFLFRRHYVFDVELLGPNLYNVIRTNCFVGMRMGLIRRIAI